MTFVGCLKSANFGLITIGNNTAESVRTDVDRIGSSFHGRFQGAIQKEDLS